MLPRTFVCYTHFPFLGVIPLGFPSQGFNEAALCTLNTSSMILKNVDELGLELGFPSYGVTLPINRPLHFYIYTEKSSPYSL